MRTEDGKGRKAAIEILLNTATISEMILKGNFHGIKEIMHKSRELGMCTFDQALYELYNKGHIGYDEAIRNADSANGLRLQIKLRGDRKEPGNAGATTAGRPVDGDRRRAGRRPAGARETYNFKAIPCLILKTRFAPAPN